MRLLLILFTLLPTAVFAHSNSNSYVDIAEAYLELRLPLTEVELAVGLDADGDRHITWRELRDRQAAVTAWAMSGVTLSSNEKPCVLTPARFSGERENEQGFAQLRFDFLCDPDSFHYALLFDIDPQHRALVKTATGAQVLSPESPSATLKTTSATTGFVAFLWQGIWHIWIGVDHVLFLLMLLLPAVFIYLPQKGWAPAPSFKAPLTDTVQIVTAFTIAHSITLTLAAFEWLTIPSRLVESAIALSVILCALNNLKPLVPRARWGLAFGFGLIHGFGFASVLGGLALEQEQLLWPLLGFNLGVEIGQLVIVLIVFPLTFALRNTDFYRYYVYVLGSLFSAALASYWLMQRLFG